MASQIIPLSNGVAARAWLFAWQGVNLMFPARSRSGVRVGDGMVVFAMPASAVHADDWGLSCLLWAPARRAAGRLDREIENETLQHCRRAVRYAMAEGFLVHDDAALTQNDALLSLRVVKAGREYWARWGHTARVTSRQACASNGKARI
jgi:hypothetical protein